MRFIDHPHDEEDTFRCNCCKKDVDLKDEESICLDEEHFCDIGCLQVKRKENYYC